MLTVLVTYEYPLQVAVLAGTVVTNDAPDHHPLPVLMAPQNPPIPRQSRPPMHHGNPVVAFMIGLSIILIASILNAAGLNLTKLDHVRPRFVSSLCISEHVFRTRCALAQYRKHHDGKTG
jgi:hypothetical protein